MKRVLMTLALLMWAVSVRAEGLGDLIKGTLIDHVSTVGQFKDGETKLALVDSVIRIGSVDGRSLVDLQLGFNGETKPAPGEVTGANFIVGGIFKVSSLLGSRLSFPDHWKFLNSIEHGMAYSYDFREKRDYVSYQVGLAFSLEPK